MRKKGLKKRRGMACVLALFITAVLGLSPDFLRGQGQPVNKDRTPVTASRTFVLSGYTQIGYSFQDESPDTFSIRRSRLTLSGEVIKNFSFKLTADATRSPSLVEAQLDYLLAPWLSLRVGQFYVPFSRESYTSDSELDLISRSQVVDTLAPGRDNSSLGRDIGAMAFGKVSFVDYFIGIFNGSGINKRDADERKDIGGRMLFHPSSFLSLGGSFYAGSRVETEGETPVARNRTGAEAALFWGPFTLKAEYLEGRDDLTKRSGWYLQAGYFILPRKLQAVLRWDSYDPDRDTAADRSDLLTLGGSWFFSEKSKVMVNGALSRSEGQGEVHPAVHIQFQVGF